MGLFPPSLTFTALFVCVCMTSYTSHLPSLPKPVPKAFHGGKRTGLFFWGGGSGQVWKQFLVLSWKADQVRDALCTQLQKKLFHNLTLNLKELFHKGLAFRLKCHYTASRWQLSWDRLSHAI